MSEIVDITPFSEHILHVDMNAFYASCEQLRNPQYKNKPVIVGEGDRAVVSAASYEARQYGVHSAMPIFKAKQICPNGIFLPVDMPYYLSVSDNVFQILHQYTYMIEKIGADEAFLDVLPAKKHYNSPLEIAQKIRKQILDEVGIICSVGISSSKTISKIASGLAKPATKKGDKIALEQTEEGILLIYKEDVNNFLKSLDIRQIYGVGPKTELKLANYGVKTVTDFLNLDKHIVLNLLGEKIGNKLIDICTGRDSGVVIHEKMQEKSIGKEVTLKEDTADIEILKVVLKNQAGVISQTLKNKKLVAKTLTLVITTEDRIRHSRSLQIDESTNSRFVIFFKARELLEVFQNEDSRKVRLIGISMSNLKGKDDNQDTFNLLNVIDQKAYNLEIIDNIANLPI